MAFLIPQLELLAQIIAKRDKKDGPLTLLSLGYPDILADRATIERLFGPDVAKKVKARPDSKDILAWHGMQGVLPDIIEAQYLFELIGVEAVYVDIVASRDIERIVDLNDPLPKDLTNSFDLVVDPGTIEHCCNIGQAVKNIIDALKPEGFVMHMSPMSMFNHGFYNINPTFFHDFYTQNGFTLEVMAGISGPKHQMQLGKVPPFQRFLNAPSNASLLVLAHRVSAQPFKWPMQSKYLANPDLKAKT